MINYRVSGTRWNKWEGTECQLFTFILIVNIYKISPTLLSESNFFHQFFHELWKIHKLFSLTYLLTYSLLLLLKLDEGVEKMCSSVCNTVPPFLIPIIMINGSINIYGVNPHICTIHDDIQLAILFVNYYVIISVILFLF